MKNLFIFLLSFLLLSTYTQAQCWQSMAVGSHHNLGIKTDGTLWAWGWNDVGQLGDGTVIFRADPVQIGTDSNWQRVAAGQYHSLGIKTDGTLWAWGLNDVGQLGDGMNDNKLIPIQIGTDSNWQSVASGDIHSLGLKTNGTLWAWGSNYFGQLGDGTSWNVKNGPVQVGTDSNWQSVTAGWRHSLGIKTDGTLWAWGWNLEGQLGNGTKNEKHSPFQIGTDSNWRSVAAGKSHGLAIKTDETLWAWGSNVDGQLGDGMNSDRLSPVQVGTGSNWRTVVAGTSDNYHGGRSFAIKADGTLWAWGGGPLGDGTTNNQNSPIQIGVDNNWQTVKASSDWYEYYSYNAAIKADGTLWIWWGLTPTEISCSVTEISDKSQGIERCYPNPALDFIAIELSEGSAADLTYEISDLFGQVATSHQKLPDSQQINVRQLPQGIYFLTLRKGNGQWTWHFVKM